MANPLIVANWKMYGDLSSYKSVIGELARSDMHDRLTRVDVVICPPFPYLGVLADGLPGRAHLGAQYVSSRSRGAYTGEVSAEMVRELGAQYTLIGHSERRQHFQERGLDLAEQLMLATGNGLTPIICVGENKREYDSQLSHSVVRKQVAAILERCHTPVDRLVVAYEPVWAIGSGEYADPNHADQMLRIIDEQLRTYTVTRDASVVMLYGGSVSPENAEAYLSTPRIDGLLVGRASLDVQSLRRICEIASTAKHALEQAETPAA